jgi:cytoskeletal protein CcmA (bactofilin family)
MFKINRKKNRNPGKDQGTVIIRGRIDGSINHAEKVIIADSGIFQGTIATTSIEVYGVLNGSLESKNIEVFHSGRVNCQNIKYDNIIIHEGGLVSEPENMRPGNKLSPASVKNVKTPEPVNRIKPNNEEAAGNETFGGPTFYSSY